MLGWSGYTLLQSRVAPGSSLLARISLFAGAGALCSRAQAAWKCGPHRRRSSASGRSKPRCLRRPRARPDCLCRIRLLAGHFGSVRTSLVLYIDPIASALLSFILGEPPT